ncbi:MAG: Hpt domain-containing protein [Christensenellaceae bacterium]|jgi:HPt (histidine-containing phosphotransfer) domain-containing protein|nr:Hpt domain-containing protein [Christensenellaceae bacterium]
MIYIDMNTAMLRMRNNVGLYKRLLKMFLDSPQFADFETALEAKDYKLAGDVAHAIKGIVGNLAMEPLFPLSTSLMNQLRAGNLDQKTLDEYRLALNGTIEEVKAYLQS